jgi:uncharacterized protein DUF4385
MSAVKKARKLAGVPARREAGKGRAAGQAGGAREVASYADAYRGIDFRAHPELYRVGRGEQGVLIAEPYKSELLPLWRFKSEAIARESAAALWRAFVGYRRARDFVGMDMARKFLQMGFTRARRYANHGSGRKYAAARDGAPRQVLPAERDAGTSEKARAAAVFYEQWQKAERDRIYAAWRRRMADAARADAVPARAAGSLRRARAARARR